MVACPLSGSFGAPSARHRFHADQHLRHWPGIEGRDRPRRASPSQPCFVCNTSLDQSFTQIDAVSAWWKG